MPLSPREREPKHSGSFYPKERGELEQAVDDLISRCKRGPCLGHPKAAMSPVAGYVFSGLAAASSFVALRGAAPAKRILLIASCGNEYHVFHGISLPQFSAYRTPLGLSPVDRDLCNLLAQDPLFGAPAAFHEHDHRIEVQLPILQRTMGGVLIVPMLVGDMIDCEIAHAARVVREQLRSGSLLVVCAPLSTTYLEGFPKEHSGFRGTPREFVYSLDQEAVNYIVNLDGRAFRYYCRHTNRSMKYSEAIDIAIGALQGWCVGKTLDHYISADAPGVGHGDPAWGQSYASVAFYQKFFSESSWISFLCHSSRDKNMVEKVADDLRHSGLRVWLDEWQLRPGDSLNKRIQEAIGQSAYLVVFLSKTSVQSPWVQRELNAALMKELEVNRVFVVPALLEDCDVPVFLRDKVYADFRKGYDAALESLLSALSCPPTSESDG